MRKGEKRISYVRKKLYNIFFIKYILTHAFLRTIIRFIVRVYGLNFYAHTHKLF